MAAVLIGFRVTVRWSWPVLRSTSSIPFPRAARRASRGTPWAGSLLTGLSLIKSSTSPIVFAPWMSIVKLTPSLRVIMKSASAGKTPSACPW